MLRHEKIFEDQAVAFTVEGSGSDGATDTAGDTFTSAGSTFETDEVAAGDMITIGSEDEVAVLSVTDETNLELATAVTGDLTSQAFTIRRYVDVVGDWLNTAYASRMLEIAERAICVLSDEATVVTIEGSMDGVTAIKTILAATAVTADTPYFHRFANDDPYFRFYRVTLRAGSTGDTVSVWLIGNEERFG